jgi:hypothetical protein
LKAQFSFSPGLIEAGRAPGFWVRILKPGV